MPSDFTRSCTNAVILRHRFNMRDFSSTLPEGKRSTHMTIAEALKKATEGGYHIHGSDGMATTYAGASRKFSAWTRKDNNSSFLVTVEETFLDPRFWHALGCALGWQASCDLSISCRHGHEECRRSHGDYWMYQWHCFIQVLAEGNPPEVFFEHLTSSPTRSNRAHEGSPS